VGVLDSIASAFGYTPLVTQVAAQSPWADDSHLADIDLRALFGIGDQIIVNRDAAMSLDVVAKVRNVAAGTIGRLSLFDEKNHQRNTNPRTILTQPDPSVPLSTTLNWTVDHLMFYPCTEWVVTRRDAYGYPARARHVPWTQAERDGDGNLVKAFGAPVADAEVIRFDSPLAGGLLAHGRGAIQRAIVIAKAAALAEDNPVPSFELHNEGADITDEQIDQVLRRWTEGRRRYGVGYTSKGIKTVAHGQRLEQLLIERQKRADLMLVRKMNAPAWVADVAVDGQSLTYNNRASRNWELIDLALAPYMSAIADRLSLGDVTPAGWRVKFDTDDLTRDDQKTRFETYEIGLRAGFVTQEQINAWEGWNQ
jgi:hypothetical protein